jgi:predicted nucleic acid-binding Zn ribbon protein
VADFLDDVTRSFGAPRAGLLAAVFAHWGDLVGPEIAAHTQPRSLRGGVLVVSADQPAWATQLRYLAADLLTRIKAEIPAEEIAEIHIRVGSSAPSGGHRRGRRPDR